MTLIYMNLSFLLEKCTGVPKMNFIGQRFRKLSSIEPLHTGPFRPCYVTELSHDVQTPAKMHRCLVVDKKLYYRLHESLYSRPHCCL